MSGRKLPWLIAGGAAAVLVLVAVAARGGQAANHPQPRLGVTAERVLPPSVVPNTPNAAEAYAAARSAPAVLDGVYCHCNCSRTVGHRSLLSCFESDHGAYCDICMGEAQLAARLAAQGKTLQQVRRAIDRQFGS